MGKKFRSILYRAAQLMLLMLLVYGFAHTLPFDLAFVLAGDYLLYFEIATTVWLAARAARLRLALDYARTVSRPFVRAVGRHGRRALRSVRRRLPGRNADEDRPWGALAPA